MNFFIINIFLFLTVIGIKCANEIDFDGEFKTGEVTWDTAWRGMYGSCGFPFPPKSDFLVGGLTMKYMQPPAGVTNPNSHPLCGPKYCLLIKGPIGSVVVKVSDSIQGNNDNVNVADTVFEYLAEKGLGRAVMQWKFVDCTTNPIGPIKTE